jgi:hypothetical protein
LQVKPLDGASDYLSGSHFSLWFVFHSS